MRPTKVSENMLTYISTGIIRWQRLQYIYIKCISENEEHDINKSKEQKTTKNKRVKYNKIRLVEIL